jgi:putative phosphoribosyl transferase
MRFRDRAEAGRALAEPLEGYREQDPIVLGLPRGGVVVALPVAERLGAPLDVIVVRKLGVPWQPELAMGAIGEGGVRVLDETVMQASGVSEEDLRRVEERELVELSARVERFRGGRAPVDLAGRTVLLVDDGIATGSTARAACRVARARGAAHIVLAVPVAPAGVERRFAQAADAVVALHQPWDFAAVGQFYRDFEQVGDGEVARILAAASGGA